MEHMLDIEIKSHLQKLGLLAEIAMQIPTEELLREFSYNDSVGILLDPTGWMAIRDNAQKNERGVRALAAFQKEIKEIWPEFAITKD